MCQLVALDFSYQKPFNESSEVVHRASQEPESANPFRFENVTGPHPTVNQTLMHFYSVSRLYSLSIEDTGSNIPEKQLALDVND